MYYANGTAIKIIYPNEELSNAQNNKNKKHEKMEIVPQIKGTMYHNVVNMFIPVTI
jgi:hypothetical protein